MNKEEEAPINKDLILREQLAIERTDMAIDRTLLSFVRTSLYFATAGWSINNLVNVRYGWWVGLILWVIAGLLTLLGFYKYFRQKKQLRESRNRIGGRVTDWLQSGQQ